MKKLLTLLIPLLIIFTGCESITPAKAYISGSATNPEMGYLVGSLVVYNGEIWSAGFGLEYVNVDNEKETIVVPYPKHKKDPKKGTATDDLVVDSIIIVPVKPGKYRLNNLLYLTYGSVLEGKDPISEKRFTQEINVVAGKMYYFGDWNLHYYCSYFNSAFTYHWELKAINDRFEETKEAIRINNDTFADWEMENTILQE